MSDNCLVTSCSKVALGEIGRAEKFSNGKKGGLALFEFLGGGAEEIFSGGPDDFLKVILNF